MFNRCYQRHPLYNAIGGDLMSRGKWPFVILILLIISILFTGCASYQKVERVATDSVGYIPDTNSMTPSYPPHEEGKSSFNDYEDNSKNEIGVYERKMIKKGSISINSNKPKDLEAEIINMLNNYNGYIVNTTQSGNDENYHVELIVKIPYDKFDTFLVKIKEIAEVRYTDINTQDVTEEYIDLTARQNTLKLQEERLLEMLKKAEVVEDLIKVENELSRIRYELEKIEGRIRYLDNAVLYSTLTISIYQKGEPTKPQVDSIWEEIWFSFKDGIGTFFNAVFFIVKGIVWLLPFIIICLPIGFIIFKKKFKK